MTASLCAQYNSFSWDDIIPREVMRLIFGFLPFDDIFNAQFACKVFQRAALYSVYELPSTATDWVTTAPVKFDVLMNLVRSGKLRELRVLEFARYSGSDLRHKVLRIFLRNCPNIRRISPEVNFRNFTNLACNPLTKLQSVRISNILEIPRETEYRKLRQMLPALTHLHVSGSRCTVNYISYPVYDIGLVKFIQSYSLLTELTIFANVNSQAWSILGELKNLTCLKIKLDCSLPQNNYSSHIDSLLHSWPPQLVRLQIVLDASCSDESFSKFVPKLSAVSSLSLYFKHKRIGPMTFDLPDHGDAVMGGVGQTCLRTVALLLDDIWIIKLLHRFFIHPLRSVTHLKLANFSWEPELYQSVFPPLTTCFPNVSHFEWFEQMGHLNPDMFQFLNLQSIHINGDNAPEIPSNFDISRTAAQQLVSTAITD
eukprot:716500_1